MTELDEEWPVFCAVQRTKSIRQETVRLSSQPRPRGCWSADESVPIRSQAVLCSCYAFSRFFELSIRKTRHVARVALIIQLAPSFCLPFIVYVHQFPVYVCLVRQTPVPHCRVLVDFFGTPDVYDFVVMIYLKHKTSGDFSTVWMWIIERWLQRRQLLCK